MGRLLVQEGKNKCFWDWKSGNYYRSTQKAVKNVKFDFVYMWEDMGYKTGPLISPKNYIYYLDLIKEIFGIKK